MRDTFSVKFRTLKTGLESAQKLLTVCYRLFLRYKLTGCLVKVATFELLKWILFGYLVKISVTTYLVKG